MEKLGENKLSMQTRIPSFVEVKQKEKIVQHLDESSLDAIDENIIQIASSRIKGQKDFRTLIRIKSKIAIPIRYFTLLTLFFPSCIVFILLIHRWIFNPLLYNILIMSYIIILAGTAFTVPYYHYNVIRVLKTRKNQNSLKRNLYMRIKVKFSSIFIFFNSILKYLTPLLSYLAFGLWFYFSIPMIFFLLVMFVDFVYYECFLLINGMKGNISTVPRRIFTSISVTGLLTCYIILFFNGILEFMFFIIPTIIVVSTLVYKADLLEKCSNKLLFYKKKTDRIKKINIYNSTVHINKDHEKKTTLQESELRQKSGNRKRQCVYSIEDINKFREAKESNSPRKRLLRIKSISEFLKAERIIYVKKKEVEKIIKIYFKRILGRKFTKTEHELLYRIGRRSHDIEKEEAKEGLKWYKHNNKIREIRKYLLWLEKKQIGRINHDEAVRIRSIYEYYKIAREIKPHDILYLKMLKNRNSRVIPVKLSIELLNALITEKKKLIRLLKRCYKEYSYISQLGFKEHMYLYNLGTSETIKTKTEEYKKQAVYNLQKKVDEFFKGIINDGDKTNYISDTEKTARDILYNIIYKNIAIDFDKDIPEFLYINHSQTEIINVKCEFEIKSAFMVLVQNKKKIKEIIEQNLWLYHIEEKEYSETQNSDITTKPKMRLNYGSLKHAIVNRDLVKGILVMFVIIAVIFGLIIPSLIDSRPVVVGRNDNVLIDYKIWKSDKDGHFDILNPEFDETIWITMIPLTENSSSGLILGLYNNLMGKELYHQSDEIWLAKCVDENQDGRDDFTNKIALSFGNSTDQYFNTYLKIKFKLLDIQKYIHSNHYDILKNIGVGLFGLVFLIGFLILFKYRNSLQFKSTLIMLFLILFPMILGWGTVSLQKEICPTPSFGVIYPYQRRYDENPDITNLDYIKSTENIPDISFNSLISIKFRIALPSFKSIVFYAELVPKDVLVEGELKSESELLKKTHLFTSSMYKGPLSEQELYFKMDLSSSQTPVLPGLYKLNIYYTAQQGLTVGKHSTVHTYQINIQKERVYFNDKYSDDPGKSTRRGSIYTLEDLNLPGWITVFETRMEDALGTAIPGNVSLYLTSSDFSLEKVNEYYIKEDGLIYYEVSNHVYFGSLMRGKIIFDGSQSLFYRTTIHTEAAEISEDKFVNTLHYPTDRNNSYSGTNISFIDRNQFITRTHLYYHHNFSVKQVQWVKSQNFKYYTGSSDFIYFNTNHTTNTYIESPLITYLGTKADYAYLSFRYQLFNYEAVNDEIWVEFQAQIFRDGEIVHQQEVCSGFYNGKGGSWKSIRINLTDYFLEGGSEFQIRFVTNFTYKTDGNKEISIKYDYARLEAFHPPTSLHNFDFHTGFNEFISSTPSNSVSYFWDSSNPRTFGKEIFSYYNTSLVITDSDIIYSEDFILDLSNTEEFLANISVYFDLNSPQFRNLFLPAEDNIEFKIIIENSSYSTELISLTFDENNISEWAQSNLEAYYPRYLRRIYNLSIRSPSFSQIFAADSQVRREIYPLELQPDFTVIFNQNYSLRFIISGSHWNSTNPITIQQFKEVINNIDFSFEISPVNSSSDAFGVLTNLNKDYESSESEYYITKEIDLDNLEFLNSANESSGFIDIDMDFDIFTFLLNDLGHNPNFLSGMIESEVMVMIESDFFPDIILSEELIYNDHVQDYLVKDLNLKNKWSKNFGNLFFDLNLFTNNIEIQKKEEYFQFDSSERREIFSRIKELYDEGYNELYIVLKIKLNAITTPNQVSKEINLWFNKIQFSFGWSNSSGSFTHNISLINDKNHFLFFEGLTKQAKLNIISDFEIEIQNRNDFISLSANNKYYNPAGRDGAYQYFIPTDLIQEESHSPAWSLNKLNLYAHEYVGIYDSSGRLLIDESKVVARAGIISPNLYSNETANYTLRAIVNVYPFFKIDNVDNREEAFLAFQSEYISLNLELFNQYSEEIAFQDGNPSINFDNLVFDDFTLVSNPNGEYYYHTTEPIKIYIYAYDVITATEYIYFQFVGEFSNSLQTSCEDTIEIGVFVDDLTLEFIQKEVLFENNSTSTPFREERYSFTGEEPIYIEEFPSFIQNLTINGHLFEETTYFNDHVNLNLVPRDITSVSSINIHVIKTLGIPAIYELEGGEKRWLDLVINGTSKNPNLCNTAYLNPETLSYSFNDGFDDEGTFIYENVFKWNDQIHPLIDLNITDIEEIYINDEISVPFIYNAATQEFTLDSQYRNFLNETTQLILRGVKCDPGWSQVFTFNGQSWDLNDFNVEDFITPLSEVYKCLYGFDNDDSKEYVHYQYPTQFTREMFEYYFTIKYNNGTINKTPTYKAKYDILPATGTFGRVTINPLGETTENYWKLGMSGIFGNILFGTSDSEHRSLYFTPGYIEENGDYHIKHRFMFLHNIKQIRLYHLSGSLMGEMKLENQSGTIPYYKMELDPSWFSGRHDWIKAVIIDKADNTKELFSHVFVYKKDEYTFNQTLQFGDTISFDKDRNYSSDPHQFQGFLQNWIGDSRKSNLIVDVSYYNHHEQIWVPIGSSLVSDGSFSVNWQDVNESYYSLLPSQRGYLPVNLTYTERPNTYFFGSYGRFDDSGMIYPFLIDENGRVTIYSFNHFSSQWYINRTVDLGISLTDKEIFCGDINIDGRIDLVIYERNAISSNIELYFYSSTTKNFEFNQSLNIEENLSYPLQFEGPVIRQLTFNLSSPNNPVLYLSIEFPSNYVNYIIKVSFDQYFNYAQEAVIQLPAQQLITSLSIIKNWLFVGAITTQGRQNVKSSIYSLDHDLNSIEIFDDTIEGIVAEITSFRSRESETLVVGISRDYAHEDDVVLYYMFDDVKNQWSVPPLQLDPNDDLFFNENLDFRIRKMINTQEENFESLLIATNRGIFKTTVIIKTSEKDVIPLYYGEDMFQIDSDINNQNNQLYFVSLSSYPVKSIITVHEIEMVFSEGKYIRDKFDTVNPKAYCISEDKRTLKLFIERWEWNLSESVYYKVRYQYEATFEEASTVFHKKYEQYTNDEDISVSKSHFDAENLQFQLKDLNDDSWTFSYGTNYQDWNFQTTPITSGLPFIMREGMLEDSEITSPTELSDLTEFTNLRMNYDQITVNNNMVTSGASLSQFATGQDLQSSSYNNLYDNQYFEVFVEDVSISDSIDFTTDMPDYSVLTQNFGSNAINVISATSNTVAYKPNIVNVDIKNQYGQVPSITFEGSDLINTLTTQNNLLLVSEPNPNNAYKDLWVDVTFQLDPNEDFKSTKYVLLSTSFAHRLIPRSSYGFGQFVTGLTYNNFDFSVLDSDSNPIPSIFFEDVNQNSNFEATNLKATDKETYKTVNFGESIYSDLISSKYYRVSNAGNANFLYPGSNNINNGLFTKDAKDRFEFKYYSNHINEEHLYDFNYLRLDTSSIPKSFVQDGKLTIRVTLNGYTGDPSKIARSELILRQLKCIVFSDKNNLNSKKWDVSGDGFTTKVANGGLYLNSGTITLDDTSIPTKSYITSNPDTKYRAVIRVKKTNDPITFTIGDSSPYFYYPSHPNVPDLKVGINSIEFTYDAINSWKFYVNGDDSGTGTRANQFNPSTFDPLLNQITDLYLSISVLEDKQIEIIELKNQVFKKIDYADSLSWALDYTDTDSLTDVGAGGETHNNLTYSDVSLNREIIYSFNEGIGDIDNAFEDLRLWSDLTFSTNYGSVTQEQYDPDFQLYNWNLPENPIPYYYYSNDVSDTEWSSAYKVPSSSSYSWEDLVKFSDSSYAGTYLTDTIGHDAIAWFMKDIDSFSSSNIYISDIDLKYDFRGSVSFGDYVNELQMVVRFTNGAEAIYDFEPGPSPPGQYYEETNEDNNPLSSYRFKFPTDYEQGTLSNGITYTDNLIIEEVEFRQVDDSANHKLEVNKFSVKVTQTTEPNTFEDYFKNQQFETTNKELTEFSITDSNLNKKVINSDESFYSSGADLSTLVPEFTGNLNDYVLEDAFGKNSMSFNIKSNIYYPNFADGLNSLSAENTITDFTIIPKLKDNEGEGLKDSPTYQYEDSWWHEQELVLANPFTLSFAGITTDEIGTLSDIIFKVNMSIDVFNFDSWSFRPNLKILDNTNSEWLPYESYIDVYNSGGTWDVWDGANFGAAENEYDYLQVEHDSNYYIEHDATQNSNNYVIIFTLSKDKYDFNNLFQVSEGIASISLMGLTYVIPGKSNGNKWDIVYEENFNSKGRMSLNTALALDYSFLRTFRETSVIKKNPMVWTDFISRGNREFEPNKALFHNITLIEDVVGVYANGSVQYFTKNFEQPLMSYTSHEPYYIHLAADGSIDYISFSPHVDLSKFVKICGIVHDIGYYKSDMYKEKTRLTHSNVLRFPFNFELSEESELQIMLNTSFNSGILSDESINNILSSSDYQIVFNFYKATNGLWNSDDYIGTYSLEDLTAYIRRQEFNLLDFNLLGHNFNQSRLLEAFELGNTLIMNISTSFRGALLGKWLDGEYSFEILSTSVNIKSGNNTIVNNYVSSPEFIKNFSISDSDKINALSFVINYTSIPEITSWAFSLNGVNMYTLQKFQGDKNVNLLELQLYQSALEEWVPVDYVVYDMNDFDPHTYSYYIDGNIIDLFQFDCLMEEGLLFQLQYRFVLANEGIGLYDFMHMEFALKSHKVGVNIIQKLPLRH